MKLKYVALVTGRDVYGPNQARSGSTMTVQELRDTLENFDDDMPVFYVNDNGYTYGLVTPSRIRSRAYQSDEGDEDINDEDDVALEAAGEPDGAYLSYDDVLQIIRDLAKSQGLYGRLLRDLQDEDNAAEFADIVERMKFKAALDFILWYEG